jgi:peptidoglycan/LPS O-acetylase OafA/YrhL
MGSVIAIALVVLFRLIAEISSRSSVPLISRSWYSGLIAFFSRGDIGVRIFFVISGFILARPFARHYLLGHARPALRSYYLRRLTRLEPPYLINIAVCAVSIAIYTHVPLRSMVLPFTTSAVYVHGFFYAPSNVINPVAWTLEMEVQFYLQVPLLTLIFLVRRAWLRRMLLGRQPSCCLCGLSSLSSAASVALRTSGPPSRGGCNISSRACCSVMSMSPT